MSRGTTPQLYYLQDSRAYVGNDVLWWALNGNGYTTDLSKAQIYSRDEALAQHHMRDTDIPWPKDYIDGKTRPAVDLQYISRSEALRDTGIVLIQRPKVQAPSLRCHGCGRFLSERALWSGACPHCETDNRP